jgi:phosphatidylinositol 3,5-bisphosphate 5-phosphatase
MGNTSLTSQALSAPPYLFAFVVVLLTAYLSDRYQSRSTFIMLHAILATLGYTAIAIAGRYRWQNNTIRYLALYPATAGFFSAITIIITWTINNQESDSRKGTGMAILNIIGQMGPLVGTSIFPKTDAPYYVRGMTICALFMALVGVLAFVLRVVLIRQNNKSRGSNRERDVGIPLVEGGMSKIERKPFVFML